jgi:hypothetical protein
MKGANVWIGHNRIVAYTPVILAVKRAFACVDATFPSYCT